MARRQQGYTYLGVLLLVLVLGMSLTGATLVSDTMRRREKEQELLYAGQQYVEAIRSYYEAGEGGISTYPRSVAELLRDSRFPGVRRHLRKPWRDPMTPSGDWDLLVNQEGGIVGVRSRSRQTPLGKFPLAQPGETPVAGKPSYRDWQFRFEPANDADDDGEGGRPFAPRSRAASSAAAPAGPVGPMDER